MWRSGRSISPFRVRRFREVTSAARNVVEEPDSCRKRQRRTADLVTAGEHHPTPGAPRILAVTNSTTSCMPQVKSWRDEMPADIRTWYGWLPLTRDGNAIHARMSFASPPHIREHAACPRPAFILSLPENYGTSNPPSMLKSFESGAKIGQGNPVHPWSRRDISAARKKRKNKRYPNLVTSPLPFLCSLPRRPTLPTESPRASVCFSDRCCKRKNVAP